MINEFEILVAKGELKLDEPLLQSVRSVFRYATASSDETHIDRGEESQRSKEAAEVDNKGRASDSTQILCYVCREAGSGNMIQCDNTDSCQGKWFHLLCVNLPTATTRAWQCPDCRSRTDIAEAEEDNPGESGKAKHVPSIGRINYPQPNPDIFIWPPDSYGSVDAPPEAATSSNVPPPLLPPSIVIDDDTIDDEDVDPGQSYIHASKLIWTNIVMLTRLCTRSSDGVAQISQNTPGSQIVICASCFQSFT
ncbi:hypothetical protein HDV57DRAFT_463253 [Trichoderma longibrachiatum]